MTPAAKKQVIAGLIVAAILASGGALAVRTFGTTGQAAVERMSQDERALLEKLRSLKRGMSFDQVVAIMGTPDDEGPLQMRPKWNVGGNPMNAVVVYIHPEGAQRFTWIHVGSFIYDEYLQSQGAAK